MFKLWKSGNSQSPPRADEGGLDRRLAQIEDRLRHVEAELLGIRTEWATYYKKLSRLAGHITKTAAIDAAVEQQPQQKPRTVHELTRDEIANLRIDS